LNCRMLPMMVVELIHERRDLAVARLGGKHRKAGHWEARNVLVVAGALLIRISCDCFF
jgi:hypothetical protein